MDAPEVLEPPRDLVFVDLETTGANAGRDRITEIGIVRMRDGTAVEEWSMLVHPQVPIPPYIERFTGITNEMVAAAPRFEDIADVVLEKLTRTAGGAAEPPIFVAHNARFDYGFLRAEFRRVSRPFRARVLCTVKLSRRLFPQHVRHSLDAVIARHALSCHARHRALGDAQVLAAFWTKLAREVPAERLTTEMLSLLYSAKLPPQLPQGLAEELPEGPGVFRFFDADDVLLYVGKNGSLRVGILGHLGEERGNSRDRKLRAAVQRVEWEETAGELGAHLRELDCLRTQSPLHNRQSPCSPGVTLLVEEESGAVRMLPMGDLDGQQIERCLGVFHSAKDARKALGDIADAKQLCAKVLGLEQGAGACVGHQRGRCKGACIGKEPPILHALRTRMALASLKLKPWPFPGRIALRERGNLEAEDLHVLDNWRYLGTARSEDELAGLAARSSGAVFDVQVYRILARYFANHQHLDWHDLDKELRIREAGDVDSDVDVS